MCIFTVLKKKSRKTTSQLKTAFTIYPSAPWHTFILLLHLTVVFVFVYEWLSTDTCIVWFVPFEYVWVISENSLMSKTIKTYCMRIWYSFIFVSFGASQAVYRNLWYIESPLWKEICFVFFCPGSQKKSTFWMPNINEYLMSKQYQYVSSVPRTFCKGPSK